MMNENKYIFVTYAFLFFLIFLFSYRTVSAQSCVGQIWCYARTLSGCDEGVQVGAGGCPGPDTEAECWDREDNLIANCEGCYKDGACGWNPGSGGGDDEPDDTCTGSSAPGCSARSCGNSRSCKTDAITNDCVCRAAGGGGTEGSHEGESGSTDVCRAYGWATNTVPNEIDINNTWFITGGLDTYIRSECGDQPCGFNFCMSDVIPVYDNDYDVRVRMIRDGEPWTLSNSPRTIKCNSRPNICLNSSKAPNVLNPGGSIDVTLRGAPTVCNGISTFMLAFYNASNGGAPLIYGGSHYLRTNCTRFGNTCTFTINYADLDRIDEASGLKPGSINVNGYFTLSDGRTSAASASCWQNFAINRGVTTVNCNLVANPNNGTAPLDTNLTGTVGGTATGDIQYRFDCDGDGTWDYNFNSPNITETRLCSNLPAGNYNAVLRVDRENVWGTCNTPISVDSPPAVCNLGLNLNPATISMPQSSVVRATVNPQNGTVDKINFRSSNPGVATVNPPEDSIPAPYQTIAASVAPGFTDITADCVMGGAVVESVTRRLTVSNPDCTVNMIPAVASSGVTKKTPFTATVVGATGPVQNVTFTSSNPGVASIDPPATDFGVPYRAWATGVSPGNTTITARAFISGLVCDDDTSSLTIEPPSCNATIIPDNAEIEIGTSRTFVTDVIVDPPYVDADISSVNYSVSNPLAASVNPAVTNVSPYQTTVTGLSAGNFSLDARVVILGFNACPASASVEVVNPPPWWQTVSGDLLAAGDDITSDIPVACDPSVSSCQPYVLLDRTTGAPGSPDVEHPGVPMTNGVINTGDGSISSTAENVENVAFSPSQTYDYQYFLDRANAAGVAFNGLSLANIANGAGAVSTGGYRVYSGGAFTIGSDTTIADGVKAVVFVNGDLNINGKISFAAKGRTFLIFIVKGNVIVNPAVGDVPVDPGVATPDIEGIYITDAVFRTGTNPIVDTDIQLAVRGSIIGHGNGGSSNGVDFQRSLPDNSAHPAEYVEFAPDQLLLFPTFLSPKPIRWREIAP
jgi:hypothetical protein